MAAYGSNQARSGGVMEAALEWARSGAMAVTGPADGPPRLVSRDFVDRILSLGARAETLGAAPFDALALLGERAACAQLKRKGATSVGGHAHLLRAADGWLALNLARPEDVDLLPAWLGECIEASDWARVCALVAGRSARDLDEQAALLGLPVGRVPEAGDVTAAAPFEVVPGGWRGGSGAPLVVDLSSLWAGPLCTRILVSAGARVVKVESLRRPDGARNGPAEFFDLLHAGKQSVAVDLTAPAGVASLRRLLERADVVVEASRPRVMEQLDIDPVGFAAHGVIWLSITGYGRTGADTNRVAFGDDAAVAGGAVLADPVGFVADAVADPIGGLAGAVAVLEALQGERGGVIDLSLRGAAAWAWGSGAMADGRVTESAVEVNGWSEPVAPPRAARPLGRAPRLGQHTAAWID